MVANSQIRSVCSQL